MMAALQSKCFNGKPVFKSHSVMTVEPPIENNLGCSDSRVDHTKPSILLSLPPYNVVSWIHLFFGFHISISPLFLATAKRKSAGENFLVDLCENESPVMVCGW